ncbi:MAG: MotA/TolQ/ExbB proton channel family protein [Fibrobacteres bacterium]|nr:MotA/TolQ/ExbB proton channel family protein [Fibrobacterota bacterium]
MWEQIARFFVQGGSFMWVILVIFAAGVAVMAERAWFYFRTCRLNGSQLLAEFASALEKNDIKSAKVAVEGKAPIQAILSSIVRRFEAGLSFVEIKKGAEETAIREIPRYSAHLNYLSLFANVATLLGLMGTIFGLITSFSSLAAAEAAQKAQLLAIGISVAMNTTAFGLIAAVPCMIAHTYLSNKQAALLVDLDETVVKALNFVESKKG